MFVCFCLCFHRCLFVFVCAFMFVDFCFFVCAFIDVCLFLFVLSWMLTFVLFCFYFFVCMCTCFHGFWTFFSFCFMLCLFCIQELLLLWRVRFLPLSSGTTAENIMSLWYSILEKQCATSAIHQRYFNILKSQTATLSLLLFFVIYSTMKGWLCWLPTDVCN